MLDLNVIRQRAVTRANLATPANPANWLTPADPTPPPISQLATVASESQAVRSCSTCRHRTVHGTCREPVAAGLSRHFGIRWPEPGRGANCPAWKRDPYEAQTLVLIEAARRLWTREQRDAWLADADTDPGAVVDVLRLWQRTAT
jgi:hypothetical protein